MERIQQIFCTKEVKEKIREIGKRNKRTLASEAAIALEKHAERNGY